MGLLEKSSNDQDAHLILENQKHSLPSFRFWSIMPLSWNYYHPIHRFSVNNMVESWLTKTILLNWRKRGVYSWNSTIWSPHLAISIYTLHTILYILKIQVLDVYFFITLIGTYFYPIWFGYPRNTQWGNDNFVQLLLHRNQRRMSLVLSFFRLKTCPQPDPYIFLIIARNYS